MSNEPASFPTSRPRRLRRTAALRRLVASVEVAPSDLILPLFVKEGVAEPVPITSMPGVFQHTRESARKAVAEAAEAGVGGVILFGIPAEKDVRGSGADDPNGIVQLALQDTVAEVGDAMVHAIADVGDVEQRRRGQRCQRNAAYRCAHRLQPQRQPAPLEAGVAGQQDASALPERGLGPGIHAQVFHGALPEAHSSSR